jgi:SAM-dependent methyltransferase
MYNRGGILKAFDIDSSELPASNLNVVFASNVLHCAKDRARTLSHIFQMLAPGGQLIFSEGAPEVQAGRAFCLAPLFGFFDGWWDRGGFIAVSCWTQLVEKVGFSVISAEPIRCGRHVLGALIACRK